MAIIKNSAKCTACGVEIESAHRHDFNVHYCALEPTPELKWVDDPKAPGGMRLEPSDEKTWRFAVDGGKEYIRRVGGGYMDTSIYEGKRKLNDKI